MWTHAVALQGKRGQFISDRECGCPFVVCCTDSPFFSHMHSDELNNTHMHESAIPTAQIRTKKNRHLPQPGSITPRLCPVIAPQISPRALNVPQIQPYSTAEPPPTLSSASLPSFPPLALSLSLARSLIDSSLCALRCHGC